MVLSSYQEGGRGVSGPDFFGRRVGVHITPFWQRTQFLGHSNLEAA